MTLRNLIKLKRSQWSFKSLTIFGVSAALIVWAIGPKIKRSFRSNLHSFCERLLSEEKDNQFEERTIAVEVETAKIGPMSRRIRTIGKLRAHEIVDLKADTSGRIRDIPITDGAEVEQGDVLIQFEDGEIKARLAIAKADYAFRKAEYERVSKLQVQNFESRKKLEETLSQMDAAKARIEETEATLAKLTLRAPFKGKVGLLNLSRGAYVQPGQDIGCLVDNSSLRIDFRVPEKHIGQIGAGQISDIRLETFKNQVFQASVDAIEPKSESESHSIKVRASMANPQHVLQHGMFCQISLIIGEKPNALSIDESAIEIEGEIEYVWVIDKGKAFKRRVLTSTHENGRAEISAGLTEGEMVVTAGQMKLTPGARVKIGNLTDSSNKTLSQPVQKSAQASRPAQTSVQM
jgi:membrane fusion protein (multidrug efflux system)